MILPAKAGSGATFWAAALLCELGGCNGWRRKPSGSAGDGRAKLELLRYSPEMKLSRDKARDIASDLAGGVTRDTAREEMAREEMPPEIAPEHAQGMVPEVAGDELAPARAERRAA